VIKIKAVQDAVEQAAWYRRHVDMLAPPQAPPPNDFRPRAHPGGSGRPNHCSLDAGVFAFECAFECG
jgi:hypothetical protein